MHTTENGHEAAVEQHILQHRQRGLRVDPTERHDSNMHPEQVRHFLVYLLMQSST